VADPIVLLHGFTQTGDAWRPLRARLEARGRRVLTPDLRGHGSASARRPVTLESVFDDLDAIVDGGVLGGYSMGGRIALAYAAARPGRVRRLVLVGASPGLEDAGERIARREADERLARRIEMVGIEAFAREWARLPLFASQTPDVALAAHAERLRQTPDGLAAALRGLGTGALESRWEALPALEVAVTLVVGEYDAKFRSIAARMARRLRRGRVVVVAGAGHAAHLEAPAAVAGELIG
jgi:2-succinyl-6-hydroxy-2,4-cyclohexadiene-1-carboxylate synthase